MFVRRKILAFSPFLFFRFSVTQTLMCELPGGQGEIVGEPYPDDSFTMPYPLVWRVTHLIDLFYGRGSIWIYAHIGLFLSRAKLWTVIHEFMFRIRRSTTASRVS